MEGIETNEHRYILLIVGILILALGLVNTFVIDMYAIIEKFIPKNLNTIIKQYLDYALLGLGALLIIIYLIREFS